MRIAVAVSLVVVRVAFANSPPAWPQYGGAGRDFLCGGAAGAGKVGERLWRRDLGPGASGIVCDGASLFTLYSVPSPAKKSEGVEVVVCLDRRSGKTLWEHRYPVARLKGQESFSGDPIRPQATPAVAAGQVCSLGYTGLLKCFHAATGRVTWQRDLVKDFEATPVQFGFSASPLVVGESFVVHVGGKQAALVAFRAADGAVVWKSKPAEPSYASPVVLPTAGGHTIVQVTRDAILGLSAKDGRERWSYAMPKPGLTNVPTPIVLPKRRLLVSGQGLVGTRLLEVTATGGGERAREVWANVKASFFYSNWVADAEAVYGAIGDLFGALRLSDGEELWRKRGQADANVLRLGPNAVLLRGDGMLTLGRLSRSGLEEKERVRLLDGRCWAAPTLVEGVLYARSESQIVAIRLPAVAKP